MSDQQSSYRQIMKATSIFAGVQVFQILVAIIRSKFIAVLLGPTGIGIAGLLNTTLSLIGGLTNFGLGTSAVKDIASAYGTGNEIRIATVSKVLKRLVWITGLLASLITLTLSQWLSKLTFGNHDYTLAFIWISITLLFNQLSGGHLAILQGMRKLQYLAKANLYGSVLGLVITVPLYYKLGIDGIVPAIIIASTISLSMAWFFARKIDIKPVFVSRVRTIAEGKSMLIMGFMISLSGLIAVGTSYIVRIFISHQGGIAQVGLYTAGFAIINTYTGLVFTAMGTDYYPRLAAVAESNELCRQTINQQAEVAILILAPILITFLVFINWVVILLYSTKFIAVNGMIYWAALGMFFKVASWAIVFLLLAKSKSKLYFWNEMISNIYMLIFNLIGYYFWGLTGLGLSFMVTYILYLIQLYVLSKIKFEFFYAVEFINIFGLQFILALLTFIIVKFISNPYSYMIGIIIISYSAWYSYVELNKRIDIKSMLRRIHNKTTK